MANVDYSYRLVFADGTTFNYVSPYEIERLDANTLSLRIPRGDTPGAEGEYQDRTNIVPDTRILSYSGKILATSANDLRDRWDTFLAGHDAGTPLSQFWRNDRYLNATIFSIAEGPDDGIYAKEWQVQLRCQPYYYDGSLSSVALAVGGTAVFVPGGNRRARPLLQLNFTHAGTATVNSINTGQAFNVTARAAGLIQVDIDKMLLGQVGSVISGNTNILTDFYGVPTELPYQTSSLALTLSGGATVSWGTALWRKRYAGG